MILVTHQLQFAKLAHRLLVLENGVIAADGTFADIVKRSDVPFATVLQSYQMSDDSSVDAAVLASTTTAAASETATKTGASDADAHKKAKPSVAVVQQEDRAVGDVSMATYVSYFRFGGGWLGAAIFFPLYVRGCARARAAPAPSKTDGLSSTRGRCDVPRVRAPRGVSGPGHSQALIAISAVAAVMSDWFLSRWTNQVNPDETVYMGIYGGLVGFTFVAAILRGLAFYAVRLAVRPRPGMWRGGRDRHDTVGHASLGS